jgi:hypothetical protein
MVENSSFTRDGSVGVAFSDPHDGDEDGLTGSEEWDLGTNPGNPDTDGDTLPDGWEVSRGMDPLTADPDYKDELISRAFAAGEPKVIIGRDLRQVRPVARREEGASLPWPVTGKQQSHRPKSPQPAGRRFCSAQASFLAPHRPLEGYARRSRLACAKNHVEGDAFRIRLLRCLNVSRPFPPLRLKF